MATRMNIVVVEDHDLLREVTVKALIDMGHDALGVDCAEALGDDAVMARPIDLLVLDLNLPGESGLSVARRFRSTQPDIGIIMLTARNQIPDKVEGYDNGADLYLTKPTSLEELGAAVHALGRRIQRNVPDIPFLLDCLAMSLQGPAATIQLSAHEVSILMAFTRLSEQRLDYWQMMSMSGEPEYDSEPAINKNTLEAKMTRLRKKLITAGSGNQPLRAIRGQGYQLCINIMVV